MLNLRDNLGWRPIQISNFMAIIGFSVTTGGKTVRYSLRHLGMRGHTTMSNLVMALAFTIQGTRSKYFSQYGALALWFFGGENGSEVRGMRGDLWAFNLWTKLWSWYSGAKTFNGTAAYGTKGVPAPTNTPGARYAGQGWVAKGRLWTFGGYGLDAKSNAGYLSDTWAWALGDC